MPLQTKVMRIQAESTSHFREWVLIINKYPFLNAVAFRRVYNSISDSPFVKALITDNKVFFTQKSVFVVLK